MANTMHNFDVREIAAEEIGGDSSRHNLSIAYALLRIILGTNIALHGITRIIAGTGLFVAELSKQFQARCCRTSLS